MKIGLFGSGNGGCNILRSHIHHLVGDLDDQSKVAKMDRTELRYLEMVRDSLDPYYLETNQMALNRLVSQRGVSRDHTILIGRKLLRGLGSGQRPDKAREAFDEVRDQVAEIMGRQEVNIPIVVAAKGTGTGTMVPLAQLARQSRKLAFAVVAEGAIGPEIGRGHQKLVHAALEEMLADGCRFFHMINEPTYSMDAEMTIEDANHAMNLSCARTLGNLIRMLAEGEKVDFNDMARVLGGRGRLFFGHSDINSSEAPTEEQLSREVESCMSSPYVKFNGQFGPGIVTVNAAQTWSKRTAGQIRNLISAEIERRDKQRHFKQNAGGEFESHYDPAPVDPYVVPSGWGFTVLIAEHDPNHEPLDLDITVEAVDDADMAFAAAPPQGGNKALPPAGGKAAAPSTPKGATTAPSHPAINGHEHADPTAVAAPVAMRFSEFLEGLKNNADRVLALAQAEPDLNRVALPSSGVKSVVNEQRFRNNFPKLSPAWQSRLLEAYIGEHGSVLKDGEVKMGWVKTARLSNVAPDKFAGLTKEAVTEMYRETFTVLKTVLEVWGDDAFRACQARITSPAEPSVAVSAPVAVHTTAPVH